MTTSILTMGNYVGIKIAENLILKIVLIRIVTIKDALPLVNRLKEQEYGVTSVDGHWASGEVKVVFTIVKCRDVRNIVELIKAFNQHAFYSIEEVDFVEKGVFPLRESWRDSRFRRVL